jgi:hypothetical protein
MYAQLKESYVRQNFSTNGNSQLERGPSSSGKGLRVGASQGSLKMTPEMRSEALDLNKSCTLELRALSHILRGMGSHAPSPVLNSTSTATESLFTSSKYS